MTTQKQIEQQLKEDFDKFYSKVYDGQVSAPKDIVELFKRGILALHSFSHKINFYKVKAISAKEVNELMVGDLNEIVKVILNTPLNKLHDNLSFDDIVEEQIKLQKFILAYNEYVDDFKNKLEMKRSNLLTLVGARNGPLKIIEA